MSGQSLKQGGGGGSSSRGSSKNEDFPALGLGAKTQNQKLGGKKEDTSALTAAPAVVFDAVPTTIRPTAGETPVAAVAAVEPVQVHVEFKEDAEGITEVPTFDDMDLKENLLRGIYAKGFEKPTAIQRKAIVPLSRGRDVIGQAQAGTGKTGAFCIAALQRLDEARGVCQALVISPTRELAIQSNKVMVELGSQMGPIKSGCFYGGDGAPSEFDNKKIVKDGIHSAVCTPGRIVGLVKKGFLSLQDINMLVIDEADEMLKTGHRDNLEYIVNHVPVSCTIALFSATMPRDVLEVARQFLRKPLQILVIKRETALMGVRQYCAILDRVENKIDCLNDILAKCRFTQGIIFVNTKDNADKLFREMLAKDHSCAVIHGDMTQPDREKSDRRFRDGDVKILIATDVISRGFDVATVGIVINFDIPDCYTTAEGTTGGRETYVHRIGRTGRSNLKGLAINFVASSRDEKNLMDIAHYYSCSIDPLPSNLGSL